MKKVIRLTESQLHTIIKKVITEQPVKDPVEYGLRLQKPQPASQVGKNVVEIQQYLLSLGYDLGPTGADGYLGAKTQAAIKQFQQSIGQMPSGTLSLDQYKQLQIKARESGDANLNTIPVDKLQRALNDWGAKPPLKTDGIRGPLTRNAIINFQKDQKIPLTGNFDKPTVTKLMSHVASGTKTNPGDVVPQPRYKNGPTTTTTTKQPTSQPKTSFVQPPAINQFM